MDSGINLFLIPQWESRYLEGFTLSVRLLRIRLERSLLYGFIRIYWVDSELCLAINEFLDGVLHTLPAPVLSQAPIRA